MVFVQDQFPFHRRNVAGRVLIVDGHQGLRDLVEIDVASLYVGHQHSSIANVNGERLVAFAEQGARIK